MHSKPAIESKAYTSAWFLHNILKVLRLELRKPFLIKVPGLQKGAKLHPILRPPETEETLIIVLKTRRAAASNKDQANNSQNSK